jgi:hypothetical protein
MFTVKRKFSNGPENCNINHNITSRLRGLFHQPHSQFIPERVKIMRVIIVPVVGVGQVTMELLVSSVWAHVLLIVLVSPCDATSPGAWAAGMGAEATCRDVTMMPTEATALRNGPTSGGSWMAMMAFGSSVMLLLCIIVITTSAPTKARGGIEGLLQGL